MMVRCVYVLYRAMGVLIANAMVPWVFLGANFGLRFRICSSGQKPLHQRIAE
jgi:hypothetical protein